MLNSRCKDSKTIAAAIAQNLKYLLVLMSIGAPKSGLWTSSHTAAALTVPLWAEAQVIQQLYNAHVLHIPEVSCKVSGQQRVCAPPQPDSNIPVVVTFPGRGPWVVHAAAQHQQQRMKAWNANL